MRIGFTYTILSLFLIAGHFVDIASTEYIYHYSKYEGSELNTIVDSLHEEGGIGIWIFRFSAIFTCAVIFYLVRPSEKDICIISKLPKMSSKNIPRRFHLTMLKMSAFGAVAILSISRLIAGVSNISGEMFHVSIPIFLHDFVLKGESEYLQLFTVIVSFSLSIIILISILVSIYFYSQRVKGGEAPE